VGPDAARELLGSLKKDKRAQEIRDKLDRIQKLKKKGLNYQGDDLTTKSSKGTTESTETPSNDAVNEGELNMNFSATIEATAAQAFFNNVTATEAPKKYEEKKTTSGIGGSWQPPPEESNNTMLASKSVIHKPSKSGSWGVFERPADISKGMATVIL
jgi:hypothetical protein